MTLAAEAAVLGAALHNPQAADQTVDLLDGVHLQRSAHQTLLDAVRTLRAEGKAPDLVTVTELLSRSHRLDEVGGPSGLAELVHNAPLTSNVEGWCRIIRTEHRRRRMMSLAERLRHELPEVDDLDAAAEDVVAELLSGGDGPATVDRGEILATFDKRVSTGLDVGGWRLPWAELDFFRLPDDGLTVVTGLPGSGKSTWIDAALCGMLQRNDRMRVAWFSPEMAPPDNHVHELCWTAMGIPPTRDPETARGWAEWFTSRCEWIDDDRHSSASKVMAVVRGLVKRQGTNVLVVDPYNNLDPDTTAGDRQDLHIQALLKRLRRFARAHKVAVIVVAHPRRTQKVEGTDDVYKIPGAGDISGGQEWWNHSDTIVTVWRNQSGEEPHKFGYSSDVRIKVSKVRFRKWGRMGKGQLTFDGDARRYR